MLEKFALLKIALCRAPVLTIDSSVWRCAALSWEGSFFVTYPPVRVRSRLLIFEIRATLHFLFGNNEAISVQKLADRMFKLSGRIGFLKELAAANE